MTGGKFCRTLKLRGKIELLIFWAARQPKISKILLTPLPPTKGKELGDEGVRF